MLKGLALTPPVVGRIAIGRIVERDGKRLPAKDDEFALTTQVHGRDGWVPHPLDAQLRKNAGNANAKLRAILQLLPGLEGESVIRDCALMSPGALPRLIALLN